MPASRSETGCLFPVLFCLLNHSDFFYPGPLLETTVTLPPQTMQAAGSRSTPIIVTDLALIQMAEDGKPLDRYSDSDIVRF